ncbi:hypothetical protein ABR965_20730, partial [Photorhabdus laumondii]|uniref:hypothetical protein n=1 Tax=Photorhabdus laumondii TaxID=2218628 RepID=UPI003314D544
GVSERSQQRGNLKDNGYMPFKIENLGYGEAHISDFEVSGVEYTLIIMEIISKGDSSVFLPENYSFDLNNFFEVSFDAKHFTSRR